MEIKAIEFPFSSNITAISEKQFDVHKKLYAGYVSKVNEIGSKLKTENIPSGNATYSEYRSLKKGQSYALDGVILHELYFKNLGGLKHKPGKVFSDVIKRFFGSYEKWQADFEACATSARGWAILSYEQRSKTLTNILLDTHDDGNIIGSFPILVLDMYEHAYFIDYENDKNKYFNRFMDNVCWEVVDKRLEDLFADNLPKESN